MAKSTFFPGYKKVAETLRKRILQGSYAIRPIPSERRLAVEFGVNYMTVRRGLKLLEDEGLLTRHNHRRVKVTQPEQETKKHFNFGFLMPTLASRALELWRTAMEKAIINRPCSVRPLLYMHWDDPILTDAVAGFDGVFLNPVPEKLPDSIAAVLRDSKNRLVVVDHDFSNYGIPSIRIFPPVFIQRLLDHLESLGHTRIGCFNTQPDNSEVRERIDQWRFWMAIHGFSGRLVNSAVPAHGDPMLQAYKLMDEILREPVREETAWFFITAPAALGAMRAVLDHGLTPGRDLALCTANSEGQGSMFNPRLTSLEVSDPTPFISYCIDWMSQKDQNWKGPLLMQPAELPLMIYESTQPANVKPRHGIRKG